MEIAQFHLNYLSSNMKIFVFTAFLAVAAAGGVYQNTPNTYNGGSRQMNYMQDYANDNNQNYKMGYNQNYDKGYSSSTYDQVPTPYHFAYEVKDAATYNDYGQQESSDGYGNVKGSYHVLLPDGRTQTVTYTADAYGYHPIVKYTGGDQYAKSYAPASYNAAPSYPTPTPSYMNQYPSTYPTTSYNGQYPSAPSYPTPTPSYMKQYPSTYPTTSYKEQYPPSSSYPVPPVKNIYAKSSQY